MTTVGRENDNAQEGSPREGIGLPVEPERRKSDRRRLRIHRTISPSGRPGRENRQLSPASAPPIDP